MNEELKFEWEKVEINWKEIKNSTSYSVGFYDFYGIVLVVYIGNFVIDFNRVVRDFKKSSDNFYYKVFYYYLIRVVQFLNDQGCSLVYRGIKVMFEYIGKGFV